MGHRMKVTDSSKEIAFDERAITKVIFDSDTPPRLECTRNGLRAVVASLWKNAI